MRDTYRQGDLERDSGFFKEGSTKRIKQIEEMAYCVLGNLRAEYEGRYLPEPYKSDFDRGTFTDKDLLEKYGATAVRKLFYDI